MSSDQCTHELHKMYAQAAADKMFFADTVEQKNDHAQRLDNVRQAMLSISHIVAEANASGERIGKLTAKVVDSDSKLTQGLKE